MHRAMVFIFLALGFPQDRYESPAMKSLADAERGFAAMSVEKGTREAFVANFADDGIAFQPHPVVYKEAVQGRPAPANPKAYTLNWKPVARVVYKSGDLGYMTGPYSVIDKSGKQPPRYGFYFSIWKKDSLSRWHVALDIGIGTPGKHEGSDDFRQAESIRNRTSAAAQAKSGKGEFEESEENFSSLAATQSTVAAYESHLASDCRLHAEGHHPFVGKAAIKSFFTGKRRTRFLFASVSGSNDVGYTYGSYTSFGNEGAKESGYFGHVWKRNEHGRWKLVAEILSPIPPETP